MSRTLDEIEAVLDVLVPNLAAAVETSKGLLNALGGTVGDIYQETPETLRLKLDYDSDEEKEKELRSDRNKSKRRSAKWKQDIVLNRKERAKKERDTSRQEKELEIRKQKLKEAREAADTEVLHPITRDAMPELLKILEDIVDIGSRLTSRELTRHLYTEDMQKTIGKRIIKDNIVVITQGLPAAQVFIAKFHEIFEHADVQLFTQKCLHLNLTNREKVIILRKMYMSSQLEANQAAPLSVKSTALVKATINHMVENHPNYDVSQLDRILRRLLPPK